MSHQVPDPVKKKRRDLIMAEQRLISRAHCEAQVGKIIRVLVEGLVKTEAIKDLPEFSFEHGFNRAEQTIPEFLKNRKKIYIARSQSDAPDIDGRVYVTGSVKPGEFAEVKVIGFSDYDLFAVSVKK
jgi:ribosomal protein S12 methylthiotransferase